MLTDGKLDFYIGNDDLISVAMSLGCKGVVSVLSNVLPEYTHEMTLAGINGESKKSAKMQKDIMSLIECMFLDVNPIMVKELMNRMGVEVGPCRLPLGKCDEKFYEIVESEIKKISEIR